MGSHSRHSAHHTHAAEFGFVWLGLAPGLALRLGRDESGLGIIGIGHHLGGLGLAEEREHLGQVAGFVGGGGSVDRGVHVSLTGGDRGCFG